MGKDETHSSGIESAGAPLYALAPPFCQRQEGGGAVINEHTPILLRGKTRLMGVRGGAPPSDPAV